MPIGGGGGGGGGGALLALGPAPNTFGTTSTANRAAAEALRNTQSAADTAWLARYQGNLDFLIRLIWAGGAVEQRRAPDGSGWTDVTLLIRGPAGPVGPAGPAGARGLQGPQGQRGATGADGTDGTDGARGIQGRPSRAEITVFRNAATAPATPTNGDYTWNTGVLALPTDWTATPTPPPAGEHIFSSTAHVNPQAATTPMIDLSAEWSAPVRRDGEVGATGPRGPDGPQGDPGFDGYQGAFLLTIYQSAASAPATPTGGQYHILNGSLLVPTGWSLTPINPGPGETLYGSSAFVNAQSAQAQQINLGSLWSAPVRQNLVNASGTISGVTAGAGLSGGGDSGVVTLDIDPAEADFPVMPLAKGGTGAENEVAARANLGLGTAATADAGDAEDNVPLIVAGGTLGAGVLPLATHTERGAISGADQAKLDGIEAGATAGLGAAATTDDLNEGTTNFYFTPARSATTTGQGFQTYDLGPGGNWDDIAPLGVARVYSTPGAANAPPNTESGDSFLVWSSVQTAGTLGTFNWMQVAFNLTQFTTQIRLALNGIWNPWGNIGAAGAGAAEVIDLADAAAPPTPDSGQTGRIFLDRIGQAAWFLVEEEVASAAATGTFTDYVAGTRYIGIGGSDAEIIAARAVQEQPPFVNRFYWNFNTNTLRNWVSRETGSPPDIVDEYYFHGVLNEATFLADRQGFSYAGATEVYWLGQADTEAELLRRVPDAFASSDRAYGVVGTTLRQLAGTDYTAATGAAPLYDFMPLAVPGRSAVTPVAMRRTIDALRSDADPAAPATDAAAGTADTLSRSDHAHTEMTGARIAELLNTELGGAEWRFGGGSVIGDRIELAQATIPANTWTEMTMTQAAPDNGYFVIETDSNRNIQLLGKEFNRWMSSARATAPTNTWADGIYAFLGPVRIQRHTDPLKLWVRTDGNWVVTLSIYPLQAAGGGTPIPATDSMYWAVRTDRSFTVADFEAATATSAVGDTITTPTYTGNHFHAFAVPTSRGVPTSAMQAGSPFNEISSFEQQPGTYTIDGDAHYLFISAAEFYPALSGSTWTIS